MNKSKNKKGQNMIEAVMIIPIFILILAFTLNVIQILIGKQTLKQSIYEGARYAIVQDNAGTAKKVATQKTKIAMNNSISTSITRLNFTHGSWKKGNLIDYTGEAKVKLLFPWIDGNFKMTKNQTIKEGMCMMIENEKPVNGKN